MAAHSKRHLTPEQYLEIERAAEFRHEYYSGEMFAMAGGSPRQSQIIFNLGRELGNGLKDSPCSVMGQDVRMSISYQGLYTYPDLIVVCGEMKFTDDRRDTLVNPSLIIEVLSPSTEAYDRGFKSVQYRQIESLREHVLVSQSGPHVEVYRKEEGGRWVFTEFDGPGASCTFESVNCRVALREIYHRVTFDDPGASPFAGRAEP